MSAVPTIELNNGVTIPQLGFGVFLVPPGETEAAVATALATGYRHIDTAKLYDNEDEVGAAIAKSGVPRDEVFVTTKVWNSDQGYDATLAAFDKSLERLGFRLRRPLPHPLAAAEGWTATSRRGGRWRRSRATAGRARSGCRTSRSRTCSG